MFQDSFLDGPAESRRPWTLAVSLLAQCLAVAVAILIPLLTAGDLPAGRWVSHLLAPPPPPPAAPRPEPARLAPKQAPAARFESTLLSPPTIPEEVAMVVDPQSQPRAIEAGRGVADVVGTRGGVPNSVLMSQLTGGLVAPPPPEKPKPESQKPQEPVRVSSDLQQARLIHKVTPVYPDLARRARISGVVRMEAIVGEDGAIRQLQVLSGHPLLVPAAREAVSQWRYRPTILGGVAVPVVTRIDVNFTLGR